MHMGSIKTSNVSRQIQLPVGVQTRSGVPTVAEGLDHFGISAQDLEELEKDELESIASPARIQTSPGTSFTKPPLPTPATNAESRDRSHSTSAGGMGKHGSSHKSANSAIMSQHQLATPASTTVSSGGSSSLKQGYANFLRRDHGGTPSSRLQTELSQSSRSRSLQTPQTSRRIHRQETEQDIRNIDSVDLTGDSFNSIEPRSSSTEIVFDDPKVVWTPGAASRPEPLPRTSKKRKSDDIPKTLTKKMSINKSPLKTKRNDISLEGFVDIDDVVQSQVQPEPPYSLSRTVQASIENAILEDDVEEMAITETIYRTETRTRTGIGRIPPTSEMVPGRREIIESGKHLVLPSNRSVTSSPLGHISQVQVARSPSPFKVRRPVDTSPSAQRHSKQRIQPPQRIIQDSDDDEDEMDLDEEHAPDSPCAIVKGSPQNLKPSHSPSRPVLQGADTKLERKHDYRDMIPRIASPLRTLSTNVVDRSATPDEKHVFSRTSRTTTPSTLARERTSSSSVLSNDDRPLVQYFLSNSSSITTYFERVKALKSQSSEECMAFTDNAEVVPSRLKDERMRILDMEKAYQRLGQVCVMYQSCKSEKKNLARQISELLDLDIDTAAQEERQGAITRQMKELEKETADLLHLSGAIKDGFGTEMPKLSQQMSSIASSKGLDIMQQTSDPSVSGSAQVILQTQFPSLQHSSTLKARPQHDNPILRASPKRSTIAEERSYRHQSSPSPVRRLTSSESMQRECQQGAVDSEMAARNAKQTSFFRPPSPDNYGEDVDTCFDDLIREAENMENPPVLQHVPNDVEDNYDDSDEDDFIEAAQRFDVASTRPETAQTVSDKTFHTPGSQPQKRLRDGSAKGMYEHVDNHAGMFDFPWSNSVRKALRERFKLRGFRQNQLDAINATLGGEDVFVLMPTGGGKSLCYQLPAIVQTGKTKGVTIVVSPLLSLMSDQVDHLQKTNVQAFLINGEQAPTERDKLISALYRPYPDQYISVLYITPEMIGKSNQLIKALKNLHKNKRLARIVIDEAHCVSQWGHDFRPDYKTLSDLRTTFPGVPFMALTATATESVKADCIHNLGMEGCKEYKQSFNRPNLYYEIRPKVGKGAGAATMESMIDLITNKYKGQSGIVYSLSRKNCEDLAGKFREAGIKAHHFHAFMEPEEKARVQRTWQSGQYQVVVATIAFGMGIDKADVRFVIHHTIPKSLEGYYQETGRAGRDGKPSGCYLFYGFQDTAVLRRFIDEGDGDHDVKESQRDMLNRMVRFCENRNDCRRADILAYFGESFSKEKCDNSCDNCNSGATFEMVDMTDLAKTALGFLKSLPDQRVTRLYVVDVLRGSKASKIKEEHRTERAYGVAKDLPRGEVERLFTRLLMDNILVEKNIANKLKFVTTYIKLGPAARNFLRGNRSLKLPVKVSGTPQGGVTRTPKAKVSVPTSTLFTSPVSPSSRRSKGKHRAQPIEEYENSDDDDDFVVDDGESSEEDAFEPRRREPTSLRRRQRLELGPPITADGRMENISDLHRDIVDSFVSEAKKEEEKLRNRNGHSKRYFTEAEFRDMAISWTLTLDSMKEIFSIDQDKVDRYGRKFIPLIQKYHQSFENIMGHNNDRDIDENHQNVIDLCSEDDEDGEDAGFAEEQSRFFVHPDVREFNQEIARAQELPQRRYERPEPQKQAARGGFKGRGGKSWGGRKYSRASNGSSGSGASRSRASKSGVSKKAPTARKISATSSRKSVGTSGSGSRIMQSFQRKDTGSGGGGGGGGIMGMPI